MGVRFGIFLSGSALANAYGGALAYGIARANANISGWRLLFIIEGVPTVLLAAIGFYCLPDRAETARFLNAREREIAVAFAGTQPGEADKNHVDVKKLFGALTDPHNWLFALANFSNNVSFSSLPLFLPTIISNIETFTDLQSNGLSAPPYLLTVFVMIGTTCLFDRVRMRGPFACFFALTAAVGYAVLATCTGTVARYTAVYLVVLIFVTVALVLVWYSNNNMFASRRAGGVWLVSDLQQLCDHCFRFYLPGRCMLRYVEHPVLDGEKTT
ncbi:hypothetical protein LTR09_011495 [Extremus antarcticus]|uniref:Uncharacterized protein n=1 Tax=Extremus antarcticus TaxID=702011 RepID=A0AAJ0G7T5_9PEZI|nr:hypothetical protein LTR09_011495 [Extremus antarcticus]